MATDPDSLAGVRTLRKQFGLPLVIFKVRTALEDQLYIVSFMPEKKPAEVKKTWKPSSSPILLVETEVAIPRN